MSTSQTVDEIVRVLVSKEPQIHIIGALIRQHGAKRVLECFTTALAIMEVEFPKGSLVREEMLQVLNGLNNIELAA